MDSLEGAKKVSGLCWVGRGEGRGRGRGRERWERGEKGHTYPWIYSGLAPK